MSTVLFYDLLYPENSSSSKDDIVFRFTMKFETLCVWFLKLTLVSGKLIFKPDIETNVGKLKYFLESGAISPQRTVPILTILPLDFPHTNHHEFVILMETVYRYSQKSVLLVDDPLMGSNSGNYFFILNNGNNLTKFFKAMDSISSEIDGCKSLLMWGTNMNLVTRTDIGFKIMRTVGLDDVILFRPPIAQDIIEKNDENYLFQVLLIVVALEKTRPNILSEKTVMVSKENIAWKIKYVKKMLQIFKNQLSRATQRILVFQRPISVEKGHFGRFQGVEISMAKMLCKSLGVKYEITMGRPEDFGKLAENGSLMLPYAAIMAERFDFGANRYPMHQAIGKGFTAIPSGLDLYCFVVRAPEHRLRTWGLIGAFKPVVWTALCATHLCIFLIFVLLRVERFSCMTVVQSRLSATNFLPRLLSHRLAWISWLFCVFLTNTAYTSSFVKQLMGIGNHPQIRTLDELRAANYTLLSEIGRFKLFNTTAVPEEMKPLYGPAHEIDERTALLTSKLTREHLFKTYGQRFYTVEECVEESYTSLLIPSHHPLLQEINAAMLQILEAGLYTGWKSHHINKHVHFSPNGSRFFAKTTPMPLTLEELSQIFIWVFGIGFGSATVAFLCEIVHFNLYGKK